MIIEKATELGIALSNSQEFKRMQSARAALDADSSVKELMKRYRDRQGSMVAIMESTDPDDLKVSGLLKEMEEIQSELTANPVFSEMMEAQHRFSGLMSEVNKVISACIGAEDKEESGCGGNCPGCVH